MKDGREHGSGMKLGEQESERNKLKRLPHPLVLIYGSGARVAWVHF